MSELKPEAAKPVSEDVQRALDRKDKVKNAEQLKEKESKRKKLEIEYQKDIRFNYRALFESSAGQDILEDLKKKFFYYDSVFDNDPRKTNVNIGNNEVIHYILKQMKPKKED